MSNKPLELARSKMDRLQAELTALLSSHGDDESKWEPGILERSNRLVRGIDKAALEFDALSERGDKIEAIRQAAMDPRNIESGFGGRYVAAPSHSAVRAWDGYDSRGSIGNLDSDDGLRSRALIACAEMDGLEPASRSKLTEMVELDKSAGEARAVLVLGNPAYRSAFDKWFRDPVSAAMELTVEEGAAWRDVSAYRAAMGTGNSGALMPLMLDSTIVLTNNGSTSSIRNYARVRTTATNQFRAVTSAGSTAEFKVEGAEAADASPTVGAVDVAVYLADQSLTVSYEIFQDTDIGQQLGLLIADGFQVQEDAVVVSGSGSGAPFGALTRISATTGSRVSPTTAGVFTTASAADIFKVRDALPKRHRDGSTAWISNISIQSVIQQMGVSQVGPNAFWADMGSGSPANLLGFPNLEATSMPSAITASSNILALVDWSRYLIVDRIGTTVESGRVLGPNGRSLASNEVFAYRRYGADLLDFNAGRVLKL
jgi:HK97 family phage major capsid protein